MPLAAGRLARRRWLRPRALPPPAWLSQERHQAVSCSHRRARRLPRRVRRCRQEAEQQALRHGRPPGVQARQLQNLEALRSAPLLCCRPAALRRRLLLRLRNSTPTAYSSEPAACAIQSRRPRCPPLSTQTQESVIRKGELRTAPARRHGAPPLTAAVNTLSSWSDTLSSSRTMSGGGGIAPPVTGMG